MSPVVKNCSRRSALRRRKSATSFCSQSVTSSETFSSDFGSSIRFMACLLAFAERCSGEKFSCDGVRVEFAAHQAGGERAAFACDVLSEALQQHVFGSLSQPELRDREPTTAPDLAFTGNGLVLVDCFDEFV